MNTTQPEAFNIDPDLAPAAPSTVAVFKDASGRYRWLSVSSTAFQDRDQQIVSTKALETDVARTDAGASAGPLRFWHVPGWDIGDCDFSAMSGRTLIESGTFRDERYGLAIKSSPDAWGMSLGFLHPLTEPDSGGTFNTIQRFERSLVPAGKASNLFTRLVIKEVQAMTDEKRAALKALLGDDALLHQTLAGVQQTEKAADAAGIAFKDASESPVDAPDIAGLIIASVNAAVAPLVAALQSISQTQAATTTKEAALHTVQGDQAALIATLKAKIEASDAEQIKLKTALTELLGDQPASGGYRPSAASDNLVPTTHTLKDAAPKAVDLAQFFGLGQ